MKRVLAVLFALTVALTASAQMRVPVLTTDVDPAGQACTVASPPVVLLYQSGATYTTYTCQSSVWTAAAVSADTATALASNPTDCSAGQYATTIAANGDLTCAAVPNEFDTGTVTVCSDSAVCDYTTVQAGLDAVAGAGTATAPKTVLVYPGYYSECLLIDETYDYINLVGFGMYTTTISCNTNAPTWSSSEPTLEYCPTVTTAVELKRFSVRNIGLRQDGADSARGDTVKTNCGNMNNGVGRFELDFENTYVYGGSDSFLVYGSGSASVAVAPSELRIVNSIIESRIDMVGVGQHLNYTGIGNLLKTTDDPEGISRCYHDFGSTGSFYDTTFVSYSDTCRAKYDTADGACNFQNKLGAVQFNFGFGRAVVYEMDAVVELLDNSSSGECGYMVRAGANTASGTTGSEISIIDSTLVAKTNESGDLMYGAMIANHGKVNLIGDTKITHVGPGTFTAIYSDTNTYAPGHIRIGRSVQYDGSLSWNSATARFENYDPAVLTLLLRANTSVAQPATAAPLDASSEYALFDDATTEYRSWRNVRVSGLAPQDYRITPRARIHYSTASASSGDVVWEVGVCSVAAGTTFPCTPSTYYQVTATVSTAAGAYQLSDWFNLSGDDFTPGNGAAVLVRRLGGDGGDTAAGDAELIAVEVQYEVR